MAGPAYVDAFRRIVVQPDNITIAADAVDDTLTLVAGAGISLVANSNNDQLTIVNTNPAQFSLGVAGDDSSIKVINSGETIRFAGSGTVTVSTDDEGKITITGASGTTNQLVNGLFSVDLDSDGALNLDEYGVIRNEGADDVVTIVASDYAQLMWTTPTGAAEANPDGTSEAKNWAYIYNDGFYVETNINVGTTHTWHFADDSVLYIPSEISAGTSDIVLTSNSNKWKFNSLGGLIFPDNTVQTTAYLNQEVFFNIAGDDSTQRKVNNGETIKFTGASNIAVTTDTDGNVTITGPTLTNYLTGTSKIGYSSGSTVTQSGNRGNGVTINSLAGTIVLVSDVLNAGDIDAFYVFNNQVDDTTDIVLAQVVSYHNGIYLVTALPRSIPGAGFYIYLKNIDTFNSANETVTIRFMVLKAPNA